jgi:hypothetical protein
MVNITRELEILSDPHIGAIHRARQVYVPAARVGYVLKRCAEEGVAIIGIEGFRLSGESIVPDTELIADYSEYQSEDWDAIVRGSLSDAQMFFNEAPNDSGLVYNFVFRSKRR